MLGGSRWHPRATRALCFDADDAVRSAARAHRLSEFCLSEGDPGGGVDHEGEQVTDVIDADEGGQLASSAASAAVAAPRRLYWWREVLYVLAFYGVYSYIRNQFGSASVSDEVAFRNARRHHPHRGVPAHLPRAGHPERVLGWHWFIRSSGTSTTAASTSSSRPSRSSGCSGRSRSAIPCGATRWRSRPRFALIGFADVPAHAAAAAAATSYGFVDTLDKFGTLWSFDSGAMSKISNQYAAMPSCTAPGRCGACS